MADLADIACDRDEVLHTARLAAVRLAASAVVAQRGACRQCGEPVSLGTFCDADCRDDYERQARADRRNGRSAA